MDRRQFLFGSTAALIGGSSAAKAAEKLASSAGYRLTVKKTDAGKVSRVVVEDAVGDRWELAADLFAGRPTLSVDRTTEVDKIVLAGARFPGSVFSFDLTASISRKAFSNKIRFEFSKTGVSRQGTFAMEAKLGPWLSGKESASAKNVSTQSVLDSNAFAGPLGVRADGLTEVAFRPDNSLSFNGPVSLLIEGLTYSGKSLELQAQKNDETSLLNTKKRKSTEVRLFKEGTWPNSVDLVTQEGWSVTGEPDSFNKLTVQTLEGGIGAVKLSGDKGLVASKGDGVSFPLVNHELSKTFGAADDTLFAANLAEGATWFHSPGGSVHVGPQGDDFVIHKTRTGELSGEPKLQALQVAPTIEGAVMSSPPHEPLPVAFNAQSVVVPALFPFDIVRRVDMLNLTFFFVNFKLSTGPGVGNLTIDKPGAKAYVVVIFPPQALAEETIPEDTSDTTGTTPLTGQLIARLANPTKLVFYIPATVAGIKMTLDGPGGLLDWDQWEQYVVPTAIRSYANNLIVINPGFSGGMTIDKTKTPTRGIGVPLGGDEIRQNISVIPTNPGNPGPEKTVSPIRTLGNSVSNLVKTVSPLQARQTPTPTPLQTEKSVPKFTSFSGYTGLTFSVAQAAELNPVKTVVAVPTGRIAVPWYSPYTSIELPTWLTISPNEEAAWSHSTSGEIYNLTPHLQYGILWHTRLAFKSQTGIRDYTEDGKWYYETDQTEGVSGPIPATTTLHPTIRAVDSFDYDYASPPLEVLPELQNQNSVPLQVPALSHITRSNLVDAMTPRSANLNQDTNAFEVERLMLTALGGTLKGEWNLKTASPRSTSIESDLYTEMAGALQQTTDMSLVSWRHIATLGRDHYVKTARRGFLYPTMHRAVLITISERKFQAEANRGIYAILRTRQFIIVSEPNVVLSNAEQIPLGLQSITCLTKHSPDIDSDAKSKSSSWGANLGQNEFTSPNAIWILVGGKPFGFQMRAIDMDGNPFSWSQPSIFMEWEVGLNLGGQFSPVDFDVLSKKFNTTNPPGGNAKCPTGGQHLSLAPSDGANPENATAHPCDTIWIGGVKAQPSSTTPIPGFRPILVEADLHIPAVEHLTGNTAASSVQIAKVYVQAGGFGGGNAGEVFLELIKSGTGGKAGGGDANSIGTHFNDVSKVGGMISPSLTVGALSRLSGAIGWPPTGSPANPGVDVNKYFQGLDAKILGVVDLTKILPNPINIGGDGTKSPKLTITPLYNGSGAAAKIPSGAEVNFIWKPKLSSFPGGANPIFQASRDGAATAWSTPGNGNHPATVNLNAKFRADYQATSSPSPYYLVDGRITDVTINAIAPVTCIIIGFQRLEFKMEAGKSAQIYVDTDPIKFAGPLSFVQSLQEFLGQGGSGLHLPGPDDQPSDENPSGLLASTNASLPAMLDDSSFGFSPYFNISISGIVAGFTLKIPSISIGILGIQNIGVSGELDLPFLIDPLRVKFSFCTRDDPFALSVWGITGGGFIGITLGLDGLEIFEGSLEFGATIALDIGIASGSVSLMAGIYFKIESGSTTLTAFVKLNGSVSVLEIISISVTFYLSLTYQNSGGSSSLTGTATVSVEVSILFFSFSVGLTVTKTIGGSSTSSQSFGNDDLYAGIGALPPPAAGPPIPFTKAVNKPQFETYWAAFGAL